MKKVILGTKLYSVFSVLFYSCLFILVALYSACHEVPDTRPPLQIAESVANRLMEDSHFEFELVEQKEVLGIQVLDFLRTFSTRSESNVFYALSEIESISDTTIIFGLSFSGQVKIWLEDSMVFYGKSNIPAFFTEVAYNMTEFPNEIPIHLIPGVNRILIKILSDDLPPVIYLRPLTLDKMQEKSISFSIKKTAPKIKTSKWLLSGPFHFPLLQKELINHIFPPEKGFRPFYMDGEQILSWTTPKHENMCRLKKKPESVFQQKSHIDWRYDNGAAIWALFRLADVTGEKKYSDFVNKYCEFTLENLPFLKWQYETQHNFRGSYNKIFRMTMLDDTGAPALPFIESMIRKKREDYSDLLVPIADYIMRKQVRLDDGTFCRPEPRKMTIWADDLFMSVPFLIGYFQITGEHKYLDEAIRQVKNFAKILYNADKGIFHHGFHTDSKIHSPIFWGRANGWIVWATSELLLALSIDDPAYKEILTIFRNHISGLVRFQSENGGWHQVLDHSESYQETSCTAMFVLGLARGINNGWIGEEFKDSAQHGWAAVKKKVREDGAIIGTCTGTGMSNSLDFYLERPTYDNDPRGIGATILAGIEIDKMIKK